MKNIESRVSHIQQMLTNSHNDLVVVSHNLKEKIINEQNLVSVDYRRLDGDLIVSKDVDGVLVDILIESNRESGSGDGVHCMVSSNDGGLGDIQSINELDIFENPERLAKQFLLYLSIERDLCNLAAFFEQQA